MQFLRSSLNCKYANSPKPSLASPCSPSFGQPFGLGELRRTRLRFLGILLALFIFTFFLGCAGGASQNANRETPPCDDCRSGEESNFEVSVIDSYIEKIEDFKLDSGEAIGVLPALSVIAMQPEKCDWCHSFSESAIDFGFAAIEDSLLAANFPNNERVLLAAEYPDEYKKLYEENSFKKIGQKYKVRYIAAAIFLKVEIIDKKTFIWESEWTLYDTKTDEFIFNDYQKKNVKSTNSSPVDRDWAKCFILAFPEI